MGESWFATIVPGLESVLSDELRSLGFRPRVEAGGCAVVGPASAGWTIALRSRVAAGLRLRVGEVGMGSAASIQGSVRRLDWKGVVHPRQPIEVRLVGGGRVGRDRVEAAVRRGIEAALKGPRLPGRRPPRVAARVLARSTNGRIELSLDASGDLLHKRGWRKATAKAPIRENLAAAVLRLAEWKPDQWLVDPMCGSGTFPIEAGQIALGLPPGGARRFAFEDWPRHEARAWESMKKRHRRASAVQVAGIRGSDKQEGAIRASTSNLGRSGASRVVRLGCRDLRDLQAPAPQGLLVCNPPWGQRVAGERARSVWRLLGSVARERFGGWRVAVVGPSNDLLRATGLPLREVADFSAGGVRLTVWIGPAR